MTLRRFELRRAASLAEALSALARPAGRARALAGGTDLLGTLKDSIHSAYPELLVDLKRIPGLDSIKKVKNRVSIGSLTKLSEVAKDEMIRERYPLLAAAARSVASPQIRNMATVGGNLCQEPRCWYYRTPEDLFHCLRKGGDRPPSRSDRSGTPAPRPDGQTPGAGRCAALLGDHRFHSVFGAARAADPACAAACPGRVEIPVHLECVRKGDLTAAARVVLERNPMPAVTGRVCPHRCEAACNRRDLDEALAIRAVELHVGSYVLQHAGALMKAPAKAGKKRVAVVGSGPAGLSAAFYLRKAGHQVTVFERMPEPGGMLAYGIPAYRLAPAVLRGLIKAYERMGIEFRTGVSVGRDGVTLKSLKRRFQAVFFATGAWEPKTLDLPGAELMQSGLALLRDVRLGRPVSVGRRVLVIGGGNVALDVAVTARRLGAAQVSAACLESRDTMPAFPDDIERALAEGIELMPSWGPRKVLESKGSVAGMELVRCTSVFDQDGRFSPKFDPAVTQALEADQVLLAIGQTADLSHVGRKVKTARGLIVADPETGATSQAGVFAGGDAVSGPASVIEAIAAGRRAASAIDRYLGGGRKPASQARDGGGFPFVAVNSQALRKLARVRAPAPAESPACPPAQGERRTSSPEAPASGRTLYADEVRVLDPASAQDEARRCVNCACVAVSSSDLGPALIALGAVIKTTKRRLSAERFFDAKPSRATILDQDELVTAVELPRPRPKTRQDYLKFRLRRSIDFPIVSVASVLELEGVRIRSARVALGAVAPVPLRAREVEEFLAGKTFSEETAVKAGEVAVRGACSLAKNAYKVQIIKALLRKLLLTGA
ncbi:MAG: FAD binding domain-containing protein [Elusimicrobia bacterium]|nr:FAD binding domain-containing protein [Elusimicrobiota bacterium]